MTITKSIDKRKMSFLPLEAYDTVKCMASHPQKDKLTSNLIRNFYCSALLDDDCVSISEKMSTIVHEWCVSVEESVGMAFLDRRIDIIEGKDKTLSLSELGFIHHALRLSLIEGIMLFRRNSFSDFWVIAPDLAFDDHKNLNARLDEFFKARDIRYNMMDFIIVTKGQATKALTRNPVFYADIITGGEDNAL